MPSDDPRPPVSRAEPPPLGPGICPIQNAYHRILALGRRGPASASTSTSAVPSASNVSDSAPLPASFSPSPQPPEPRALPAESPPPDCGSKRKHLARSTSWASLVCPSSQPTLAPSAASVSSSAPLPSPAVPSAASRASTSSTTSASPTHTKKTCTKSRRELGLRRTLCPEPPAPPPLDPSLLHSAAASPTPTPVPTRPTPAQARPLGSCVSSRSQAAPSVASTRTARTSVAGTDDVEMESASTAATPSAGAPSCAGAVSRTSRTVWRALKSVIVNTDAQSSCPHQCSRAAPDLPPTSPKVPVIVRCALDAQADLDLGASLDKLALGPRSSSSSGPSGSETPTQPDLSPQAEPLIHSPFLRIEHFMIPNPALRQGETQTREMPPPPPALGTGPAMGNSVTAFPTTPARGFVMLVYLFMGSMELIDSRPPSSPQPPPRAQSLPHTPRRDLCRASDEMQAPDPLTHTTLRRGNGLCLSMGRGLIYTLKAVFPPPPPMPTVHQPPLRGTDGGCPSMQLRQGFKAKLAALCPGEAARRVSCPSEGARRSACGALGGSSSSASAETLRSRPPSHAKMEDYRFVSGLRIWLDVPRWAKFSEPCGLRFNRLDMVGTGRALPCSSPFAETEPAPAPGPTRPPGAPAEGAGLASESKEGTCNAAMHLLRPRPGVSESVQGSGWEVKVVFDVGCHASYRVLGPSAAMHAARERAPSPPPAFSLFDVALAPGGRYFCPIPPDRSACVYTLGPGLVSIGDKAQARARGLDLPTYGKYVTLLLAPVVGASPAACGDAAAAKGPGSTHDTTLPRGVWINHAAPPAGSGQDPKPVRLAVITARPTPPDQTVCWPSPRSTTVAAGGSGCAGCTGTSASTSGPASAEPAASAGAGAGDATPEPEGLAQCPLRAQYERMLAEEQFILTSATERAMTIQDWRSGRNGFENREAFTV